MTNDKRLLNRQTLALFNFWLKKGWNDKRIGDLSLRDFLEVCVFLKRLEAQNDTN